MRFFFSALIVCLLPVHRPIVSADDAPPHTGTPAATQTAATTATSLGDTAASVETVVIFRHGEKPAGGKGQLTPQGRNGALALTTVLPGKFGKPDYLFAPDPRQKVGDAVGLCNYVRPLATIEPTAILLEMPVQTPCGYRDVAELEEELAKPQYHGATIFVAWEHIYARTVAADLVKAFGGDNSIVPSWPGHDYDSLYVVKITRAAGRSPTVTFTRDHEGLDGQSTQMPVPAPREVAPPPAP